jgi:8-oxo-dGTP pyrophosphatase MutT (NUDIX family)
LEGEIENRAANEHDAVRWFAADELAQITLAHPQDIPIIINALGA